MSSRSLKVILGGTLIDGTGGPPIRDGAVVISGSRIVEVGPAGEVDVPRGAEVIDAAGRTVMPGFIDAHTHFMGLGVRTLTTLDLSGTRSISEVLSLVRERLAGMPRGTWLLGRGWDESKWVERRYITKRDLDPVSPENPVALVRVCGHLITLNTRALQAAKITRETPDPPGGKIDRDPVTGEPTGVLRDAGMLVYKVIPPTPKEMSLKGLRKACEIALSLGCTSIHEAGMDANGFRTYQTALEEGLLTVRAYVMPRGTMIEALEGLGVRTGFGNEHLKIGSVKFILDGSMGAHTAALFEPYADDPSTSGIFVTPPEKLREMVMKAHSLGMQVAIHAIGDRGIEEALNALEAALEEEPREDHRHRIEHCEVLTEDQIARIKRLGVIASMQPNFVGEWSQPGGMYEERLGPVRLRRNNPYRRLLDEGIKVSFGSDCMPFHPLYGLWSAVNHPIEESRITLEEAVRCYTLDAAYASFEEDLKGSLEPGKLADIIILSEDLASIPPEKIRDVKVDMTMVGGKVLYGRVA
ncbi:amidohydrolase [Candidatus Bathyarchaeota archaeon]|nr:amidohydrolase [Candidatus Bathyarchaeota archaeon]